MKGRFGFVSNSSSTSFVILVKPDKVEAVDFILRNIRKGETVPSEPVPERRETLLVEIGELNKDISYVAKLVTKLNKNSDKKSIAFHNFLDRLDNLRCKDSIRNFRQYPVNFDKTLEDYSNTLNRLKEDLEKEKAKCEKQVKLLEGNDTWRILSFEDDAHWGILGNMVDDLLKTGDAVILSQETT